jgi:hypothetical protein
MFLTYPRRKVTPGGGLVCDDATVIAIVPVAARQARWGAIKENRGYDQAFARLGCG